MQVRATALGHDGQQIRQPGEVFTMPDGIKGSWFEPVKEPEAKGKPGKKQDDGEQLV